MTPQAHLVDTSGVLRYRGPIDDNRYETRVKHNYLKDALVAVLNGKVGASQRGTRFRMHNTSPRPTHRE